MTNRNECDLILEKIDTKIRHGGHAQGPSLKVFGGNLEVLSATPTKEYNMLRSQW